MKTKEEYIVHSKELQQLTNEFGELVNSLPSDERDVKAILTHLQAMNVVIAKLKANHKSFTE